MGLTKKAIDKGSEWVLGGKEAIAIWITWFTLICWVWKLILK